MPSDMAFSLGTVYFRGAYIMAARKNKQQDQESVEEDVAPTNPHLTAVMPGAVVDHDQARQAIREHTARLNGQGADAAAISAGGSSAGDVTSTVSAPDVTNTSDVA